MKATFFTLAVAGLAAAQNLDGVAPCVRDCIEKSLAGAGCTGTEAQIAVCACKPETQAKLLGPVAQCATENKCNTSDLIKAQAVAAEQCKAIATVATSKTGSSSASASASASGSGASSGTATGATTTAVPTVTSTTGSHNNSTSQAATGTAKTPTSSGAAGSGTTTSATTTPTHTGAAAAGPVVGALAAVLAAALAL